MVSITSTIVVEKYMYLNSKQFLLSLVLIFTAVPSLADRLSTPPIKIIDPRNPSQVLILTSLWCSIPDAYQFGVEVSRDSLYAPKEGCYWLDDQNKYIFIESDRFPYQKIKVLTLQTGKAQTSPDFMTLSGREKIAAKQNAEIDKLKSKIQQDKPVTSTNTTEQNGTSGSDIAVGLEDAKKKCTALGFKAATEAYGKCVLQLSK